MLANISLSSYSELICYTLTLTTVNLINPNHEKFSLKESYGHHCGLGTSSNRHPIDDIDMCCYHHDRCDIKTIPCNIKLINCLLNIDLNELSTYKLYTYVRFLKTIININILMARFLGINTVGYDKITANELFALLYCNIDVQDIAKHAFNNLYKGIEKKFEVTVGWGFFGWLFGLAVTLITGGILSPALTVVSTVGSFVGLSMQYGSFQDLMRDAMKMLY